MYVLWSTKESARLVAAARPYVYVDCFFLVQVPFFGLVFCDTWKGGDRGTLDLTFLAPILRHRSLPFPYYRLLT